MSDFFLFLCCMNSDVITMHAIAPKKVTQHIMLTEAEMATVNSVYRNETNRLFA